MNISDISEYKEQVLKYSNCDIEWDLLKNKTFLISGATGMIGKCLIDIIMYKNVEDNLNCRIIALGRSYKKAQERLGMFFNRNDFEFVEADINEPIMIDEDTIDFVLHAASSTHPLQYSEDPIGTITANVIGLYNLLELAKNKNNERFIFASSVEIYGENRGDVDKFNEEYLGYIDCNTLRAGYPESKRVGESLCQAYIRQNNMNIVIARLSRVFGPTMLLTDSKASSQFLKNAVNEKDIVLKSKGNQNYSYTYVFDAVFGILLCLTKGKLGEAYNISDEKFDITLSEFAQICANYNEKNVVFDLPDADEQAGYSTATKALLDNAKIKKIGWDTQGDIKSSINETIKILKKAR